MKKQGGVMLNRKRRIISTTTVQAQLKNEAKLYLGNKINPSMTTTTIHKPRMKKSKNGCGCGKKKKRTKV